MLFKPGDVIIRVGGQFKGVVESATESRYFVSWIGGGDSMLWVDEVDDDYVLVEREGEDDEGT